ncbi:hypothetical protein E2C01_054655 [Portunus trituberculatus]|uniref:Uncharacterized protein n=1 Tax=Portunus trituberculatus TaxID=210409 RepID=A0A5B7GP79_PORTR|nr:hypothetical protein [Portunus trituberculatus]
MQIPYVWFVFVYGHARYIGIGILLRACRGSLRSFLSNVLILVARSCPPPLQDQTGIRCLDQWGLRIRFLRFRDPKCLLGISQVFFKKFAAFLRFQEGSKYVSFPDMVSAMVTKEVEGRLAPNTTSLTAAPSLSVQGAVQSATNPPPGLSTRQSVKSLLADVPVGGNREQERPGDELGLDQAVLSHDPWGGGKCSRIPKDHPWRIKRSRPEVEGDLDPSHVGSPSGRGQGRNRRVCPVQRLHPQTLGEGPAVQRQGALTEDSVKPTQLERGAIHAMTPVPSWSTRHTGVPGTDAISYASFHHEQFHPVAPHSEATGSVLGSLQDPGSPLHTRTRGPSGDPGLPGVPSSGYVL